MARKRSFFEKLTGSTAREDEEFFDRSDSSEKTIHLKVQSEDIPDSEDTEEIGELALDVHETDDHIIVQAMLAGVYPEDVDLTITRDMIKIEGSRREERESSDDNYHYKELYWGSFARTISLPAEVEPEEAEATEKHGLLTIKLSKINKDKQRRLKVRSV